MFWNNIKVWNKKVILNRMDWIDVCLNKTVLKYWENQYISLNNHSILLDLVSNRN